MISSISQRIFFSIVIFSLVFFSSCRTRPEGGSPLPKRFVAQIGGFLGSTYSVELMGDTLIYAATTASKSQQRITPTPEQWRAFRTTLWQLRADKWRTEYVNRRIMDGTQWDVQIAWDDIQLNSAGSNAYPHRFKKFLDAVTALLGGRTFK